jgi:tripartite ATP-independent transporter DctM subunit
LAAALALYIYIRVWLNPDQAPLETGPAPSMGEKVRSLAGIWHALLLVVIVLGAIYTGIATPSEAAAFGAAGAFMISALVFRTLTWRTLGAIFASSVKVSSTILLIIGCAKIFGDYLNLVRVPEIVAEGLTATSLPSWAILVVLMLALVLLGMLVDAVSLIVVTTPILLPLIQTLGYDPLWFGIILVMNLEIAVVTPPVGLNLYALRGVCPMLSVEEIVRSIVPFVAVQFVMLMIFVLFPGLSLWLPSLL